MASSAFCVKNDAAGFTFYVGLISQADTKLLKAAPTLAAGDFKVSIDGAAFANLGTLPTVAPAAGRSVKIVLSQAEINGDRIVVTAVDAAGAEWCDGFWEIPTVANGIDLLSVNVTKVSGTTQTARDLGASVLLSPGTGTGQLDITSGVAKGNVVQFLGTAITETAGQIAGAFTKFFNKATPTGTVNSLPDAVAGAASGVAIVGSNMGTASSVTGAVGSVTGNVGGNVVGSVASVTAGVTLAASAVQAIWDALTSALTTVGSIGKLLVTNVDAAVSSRSTYAGGDTAGTTTLLARITALLQTKAEADTAHGLLATAANLTTAQADLDDIQARIPAALAADGSIKASLQSILGTALTESAAGRIVANFKTFFNVAAATGTQDVIPTVTTLTNAPSDSTGTTTLLSRLTAIRAGYLDNLSAGAVALASALASAAGDITTLLSRLTSGRAGNLDNLDTTVSSRSVLTAADVWTYGTRTLSSYGTLIADIWAGLTAGAANKVADHTWRRNSANIEASANGDAYTFRSPFGMVRKLTNKLAVIVGVLTVYKEDDVTVAGQQTETTDPAAENVTGLDTV